MRPQQTIARPMTCSGVGLHTGQPVTLTLKPAAVGTGIVFVRQEPGSSVVLSASVENLVPTELCTGISAQGMSVKTVEHLLAALVGLGIDNIYVELDGAEVPVMDGSAGPFVRLIRAAGIVPQERRQPYLKITHPIEVIENGRRIAIHPSASTGVTYSIEYDHPLIQRQTYVFEWSASSFEREIANARTFGFLNDVEALWARGLGKGGSLENTVVLGEQEIVNQSGLRYKDEFVRHKILDLIGDFALLGMPFVGHLIVERGGHALHARLVERILEQSDKWMLLSSDKQAIPAMPATLNSGYLPVSAISAPFPA